MSATKEMRSALVLFLSLILTACTSATGFAYKAKSPASQVMLSKLKRAFGGAGSLEQIDQFSATLTITDQHNKVTRETSTFYDFTKTHIAQLHLGNQELYLITPERSEVVIGGLSQQIEAQNRQRLVEIMQLNFFYLLRNKALKLVEVLDGNWNEHINELEHKAESWWILQTPEQSSPALGLDPQTGHIRKVLFASGRYVVESDYRSIGSHPTEQGVMWPHTFTVIDKGEVILKGEFSNVSINSSVKFETPKWFYDPHSK